MPIFTIYSCNNTPPIYTPQTDRSSLASNDALWSAYKDATCDLLSTDSGVVSAIPQGICGGTLLCERLEGTLA